MIFSLKGSEFRAEPMKPLAPLEVTYSNKELNIKISIEHKL